MGNIYVNNTSKTKVGICKAHDGDSIHINPLANRIPIDEKFSWQMSKWVIKDGSDGAVITNQRIEEVSNLDEAMERVKARRAGIPYSKKKPVTISNDTQQSATPENQDGKERTPIEAKADRTLGTPDDHVPGVGKNPTISTGGPHVS